MVPKPCLLCVIRTAFTYAGVLWKVMPWRKKTLICLGLLSEQHKPCHQWCLLVTKLLSPFQTANIPKCLMNQGEKFGVILMGETRNNKAQERSPAMKEKKNPFKKIEQKCPPLAFSWAPFLSHLPPDTTKAFLCFNKYGSVAVCSPGPYLYSEVTYS